MDMDIDMFEPALLTQLTLSGTAMNNQKLRNKMANGEKLRVLFINDVGFQYGAGIALLRQIQSFLLMGHEVAGICWSKGDTEASVPLKTQHSTGQWLGITELSYLHTNFGLSEKCITENLVLEAKFRYPDVIIVGNLHAAKWPLSLLPALRSSLGCKVIAFMHDCYLITGRCAYTGNCNLYESSCNETCPTWDQYPSLAPEHIFDQWLLRRQIFCGAQGIPIATNSVWTQQMAQKALKGLTDARCIYYGLDEELFKPIDKAFARRLLGIDQDKFVMLGGSVNISDHRKGTHIFKEIVHKLRKSREQVHFLVFGENSKQLSGIQGTDLVRDYRRMPLIFSAADLFVGTSLEEAFGQTFCEASACGVPIVAFNLDGIPEIARHNLNARLANETTAEALIKEIEFFMENPDARQAFGQIGRSIVETEFTLKCQGERWMDYLCHLAVH
jgi:glycosyltransferase involved in cell wall biosynthesis